MTARIEAHKLGLDVPIYLQSSRDASHWARSLVKAAVDKPRRENRTLLHDISFRLGAGDRLAIIGRNGAGKSTLLRLLAGAFAPTRGSVEMIGSCQSLLNISLGFNGEATVRENIYLRGAAMGIRGAQLRTLVDPILEFAGLDDKRGHRLKTLSAGQRLRLGFAVATSVQHDIMLMDEWIGAGDAEFISKARSRLIGRVDSSSIVVLASHSASLLKQTCNLGIVLDQGVTTFFGSVDEALAVYSDSLHLTKAT